VNRVILLNGGDKMSELKFPTLMIQLANEDGLPYDYPNDWLETVLAVAHMVHKKHKCGIDMTYGLAERKHMTDLEEAVGEENE